jgi:hypothetical protein
VKTKLLLALCFAALSLKAQLLDDFNDGTIDSSKWSVWLPSTPNQGLTEASGNARFHNGAALITTSYFENASISGRFKISGWEYDRFKVIIRSDGVTVDTHWQERIGGLGIQFTSGSNPDYGASQTLQLWNFQTGTLLTSAAPIISMNTYYDFLITDSGSEIKVFLGDLLNPALSFSTTTSYGNKIEFCNRSQLLGWPSPYYSDLDFVSIVPEPSSFAILLCFGALALRAYRANYSL